MTDTVVGYQGDVFMDSGYFYAPYIPLDPENFQPRQSILTRYGPSLSGRFYSFDPGPAEDLPELDWRKVGF